MRSQLLDGSPSGVAETVRHLGFLQLDPVSAIAPAQHLVLWSRLGAFDVSELDRLLWVERSLFEWNAFVWPIETLPLLRALMRRRRPADAGERNTREFLRVNARFKRYVLRELERHGPLLSRELADDSIRTWKSHGWHGSRNVAVLLEILHDRGVVAVAGRRNGQRLWDLAERWYPETETVPLREAERELADRRYRALGVRSTPKGWEAHPNATDGEVRDRIVLLSPFDRLIHDRERAEALFGFRYRLEMFVPEAKREYGYYVLPILHGAELIGRIEPVVDRRSSVLTVKGVWAEPGAQSDVGAAIRAAVDELAAWLDAEKVVVGRRVPRAWAAAIRG